MFLQQIKQELEGNELLRKDLGPFREERGQWNTVSLYLDRYNAKITIASSEQSIRSFRHMQHRPQLIICDDLEDLESVKTREGREKLYNWLMSDVIPAGSRNTRMVILGGIFHEDSLLNKLRKSIAENKMNGVFLKIPFLDEDGNPAWKDKYPDTKSIEDEKKKIGDDRIWSREYMLRIVGDIDQVIDPVDIQYYDELLDAEKYYSFTATGVDPAFSVKANADYTAMISGRVYTYNNERHIYILPHPVNERLKAPDMIDRILMVKDSAFLNMSVIIVEDVAAQKMIIQELESKGVTTVAFRPGGSDKMARLAMTAARIKSGHILFPRTGAEQLINQLVNFGIESHDDLADAFTTLVLGLNSYHPAYIGFA
jgi:predicted phage terminase large subunit-like protein